MNEWKLGVPKEVDVSALRREFVPAAGKQLSYTEVEKLIGCSRKSCRFRSVTTAWRRQVYKETGHLIVCERSIGFLVACPGDRISWSSGKFKNGVKQIKRSASVASSTDRTALDESKKQEQDHLLFTSRAILGAIAAERKRFMAPKSPPQQLTESKHKVF